MPDAKERQYRLQQLHRRHAQYRYELMKCHMLLEDLRKLDVRLIRRLVDARLKGIEQLLARETPFPEDE